MRVMRAALAFALLVAVVAPVEAQNLHDPKDWRAFYESSVTWQKGVASAYVAGATRAWHGGLGRAGFTQAPCQVSYGTIQSSMRDALAVKAQDFTETAELVLYALVKLGCYPERVLAK